MKQKKGKRTLDTNFIFRKREFVVAVESVDLTCFR